MTQRPSERGADAPGSSSIGGKGAPDSAHQPSPDSTFMELQGSPDFVELRKRYRGFSFPMTAIFLAWYLLYVICSGWARGFMGTQVIGRINVAFIWGLLQFASTFLIAFLYSRHANRSLDPLSSKLRERIEGGKR